MPSTLPARVILGFRAESAALGMGGEGLLFRLDYVEDLGSVKHVQGYVGDQKTIITVKNDHEIPATSDLRLMLKPEDLHIFDPLSGRRLG
jgi:sn-glycerol 3-phosphate transport system ATP-binding protein